MYPDTDLPPKEVPPARIETIEALLGEPPWLVAERIQETGVSRQLAWALTNGSWTTLYEEAVAASVAPATTATVLANIVPGLAHQGGEVPSGPHLMELLVALRDGTLLLDAAPFVLRRMAQGTPRPEAMVALDMVPVGANEAGSLIDDALAAVPRDELRKDGETAVRAVMGRVMRSLRGKVAGSRVREQVVAWLGEQR